MRPPDVPPIDWASRSIPPSGHRGSGTNRPANQVSPSVSSHRPISSRLSTMTPVDHWPRDHRQAPPGRRSPTSCRRRSGRRSARGCCHPPPAERSHMGTTDLEGSLALAYDAARKAAEALLARQGLRATTRGGHIAVVAAITAPSPGVASSAPPTVFRDGATRPSTPTGLGMRQSARRRPNEAVETAQRALDAATR